MKIARKLDKTQIKEIYGKREPSTNKKPRNNDKYGFCKPQKTAIARHWGLPNDRSCWACGATDCEEIHSAHIKRRDYGGLNIPSNFHLLCIACHGESEFLFGEPYRQWFLLKRKFFKHGSLNLLPLARRCYEGEYLEPVKALTELFLMHEIIRNAIQGRQIHYENLEKMESDWEFDVYE